MFSKFVATLAIIPWLLNNRENKFLTRNEAEVFVNTSCIKYMQFKIGLFASPTHTYTVTKSLLMILKRNLLHSYIYGAIIAHKS